MTVNSAFHLRTSALTQSFAVARDVWLPSSYESARTISEYWACRSAVTVQDMSSLRKYDVLGPDAETLLQACLSGNIAKLSANRAVYALMLSDTGSVIDDGTLFRLNQEAFRWCCGSEESARQLKRVAEERDLRVWIKALWSAMPNLAVQGPNSRELMKCAAFIQPHQPALENLRWFSFTVARLGDRQGPSFMLSRTGYTGELGYEIFCSEADSLAIWDALMEAGGDLGLQPMGSDALEILRVEAGLMAAGHEFLPGVDAHETGLGFAVDMAKGDFIGRTAFAAQRRCTAAQAGRPAVSRQRSAGTRRACFQRHAADRRGNQCGALADVPVGHRDGARGGGVRRYGHGPRGRLSRRSYQTASGTGLRYPVLRSETGTRPRLTTRNENQSETRRTDMKKMLTGTIFALTTGLWPYPARRRPTR